MLARVLLAIAVLGAVALAVLFVLTLTHVIGPR